MGGWNEHMTRWKQQIDILFLKNVWFKDILMHVCIVLLLLSCIGHTMGRSIPELAKPMAVLELSTPGYFAFVIIIMHIAMMLPSGVVRTIMHIAVFRGVRTPYMLEVKRSCILCEVSLHPFHITVLAISIIPFIRFACYRISLWSFAKMSRGAIHVSGPNILKWEKNVTRTLVQ